MDSHFSLGRIPKSDLHLPDRVVFVAVYYKNIWQSKSFPFVSCYIYIHSPYFTYISDQIIFQLSQELFYANGTVYDQLLILNDKLEVDPKLLAEQGLVGSMTTLNLSPLIQIPSLITLVPGLYSCLPLTLEWVPHSLTFSSGTVKT